MRIETTILSQLIHNEDYCRKAIPFLKEEDLYIIESTSPIGTTEKKK